MNVAANALAPIRRCFIRCRLRIMPAFAASTLAVLMLLSGSKAFSQVTSASMKHSSPGGTGTGDLPVTATCTGTIEGGSERVHCSLWASIRMSSPTEDLGTSNAFGTCDFLEVYRVAQTTITRTDRTGTCTVGGAPGIATVSATKTLVARRPVSLQTVTDTFSYTSPGHYNRHRVYQVNDNYQKPYGYNDTVVNETYSLFQTNGCGLQRPITGIGNLNNQARFQDDYYANGIPMCSQNPSCTSRATQRLTIAGVQFNKSVTWSCTNVQVN